MRSRRLLTAVSLLVGPIGAIQSQATPVPELRAVIESRIDLAPLDLGLWVGAIMGPRGQILLPSPRTEQLIVLDSTGRRIGTLGDGLSPGFHVTRGFGWVGDSVWSHDRSAEQVVIFGQSGKVASTITRSKAKPTTALQARVPLLTILGVRAPLADGSLLVEAQASDNDPLVQAGTFTGKHFIVVGPDGFTRTDVAAIPPLQRIYNYRVPDRQTYCSAVVPFPNDPVWSSSSDGSRVVIASAQIPSSDGGTIRVVSMGIAGDTIWAREIPFRGRAISPMTAAAAVDAMARELSTRACGSPYADAFRADVLKATPPAHPPLIGLLVGRDNSVWLQASVDRYPVWTVFDARGQIRGTVSFQGAGHVAGADGDRVWFLELRGDQRTLVRYRIEGGR